MTSTTAGRDAERRDLVRIITAEAKRLSTEVETAVNAPGVLEALAAIPRENFVDPIDAPNAYRNCPLPIGHSQTISQPFVVALMTGLLQPAPSHRILEIGTGSGYQAAILSRLVSDVYSIEVVPQLAARADAALKALAISNVHIRVGDGHLGWPEASPFDGIIVTAAAEEIPDGLVAQLRPGGRLVLPLGRHRQMLTVLTKDDGGHVITRDILPVRFVPFVSV